MDIFDKTIAKIGRIIGDNRKMYDAVNEEKIPPYLDCSNERELIDAYGGDCITKRQLEEGKKYFASMAESISDNGKSYRLLIGILSDCVTKLRECQYDLRNEKKNEKENRL